MDINTVTGKAAKMKKSKNFIPIAILILLIIQVGISGYSLYNTIISNMRRQEVQATVSEYSSTLDDIIDQMLADFKTDVYENPNVDTAARQTVMASEYNFNAVMLLAKQNARIMEILTRIE